MVNCLVVAAVQYYFNLYQIETVSVVINYGGSHSKRIYCIMHWVIFFYFIKFI